MQCCFTFHYFIQFLYLRINVSVKTENHCLFYLYLYKCSGSQTFYTKYHLRKYLAFQVPPLWPTLKCSINGCPLLRVCVHGVCVCVHFGWVKCRAQIPSMSLSLSAALYTVKKIKNESVLILIRIFIIVCLLKYSKYTVWTWTLHRAYFHVNKKRNY